MQLKTNAYGFADPEAMLLKFDDDLLPQWTNTLHGFSTNNVYQALDIWVGTTQIWQVSAFYVTATDYKYAVQVRSKSDGSIVSEMTFSNSKATHERGKITLNTNETYWYTNI